MVCVPVTIGETFAMAPASMSAPLEVHEPVHDESTQEERPWVVIVWNDPINLMDYVTFVFQKLFGYPLAKAEKLMMDVHEQGHAVVAQGPREQMELHAQAMHDYGLWATVRRIPK